MSQVTGVVEQIDSRMVNTRNGEAEAFNIKVDGQWYSAGFNKPKYRVGSNVRFNTVQRGKYTNVNGDVEVLKDQPTTASAGVGGPNVADLRQKSITLQSAFKVAPEIVNGMLEAGILTFPKTKKEANQDAYVDYVTALAYQLQEKFLDPDAHNPLVEGSDEDEEDVSFEEFDDVE